MFNIKIFYNYLIIKISFNYKMTDYYIPKSQINQLNKLGLNIYDFLYSEEYRQKAIKDISDGTYNKDFLDVNNQEPLETLVGSFLSLFIGKKDQINTVPSVDLKRYSGLWYEIARLPNEFEKDSYNVTAEYLLKDGYIEVINSSVRKDGTINKVVGIAKAKDSSNAKLDVTFFWPFSGEYNIIDIDESYEYSVVCGSDTSYLWILSRKPKIDKNTLSDILEKLTQFDTSSLIYTNHYQ